MKRIVGNQLRNDSFSVERRAWYSSMQEEFSENYDNFRRLQTLAELEDEAMRTGLDHVEKGPTSLASLDDSSSRKLNTGHKSIVSLNSIGLHKSDTVAILFPGLCTNHSSFQRLVESTLNEQHISSYGICLPGRMHRVKDPSQPTMRLVIYELLEEFTTSDFFRICGNKKFLFIGYSYGALIAYELIRLFINQDLLKPSMVKGLIVISCRSPKKQSKYNIDREGQVFYHLEYNDANLIRQMILFESIPSLFYESKELLRKFVPFFRQEFQLLETYVIEAPFIPGQTRSLSTVMAEYTNSYFYHYFASLVTPPNVKEEQSPRKQSMAKSTSSHSEMKLISYNSATSIATLTTVSSGQGNTTIDKAESKQNTSRNNSAIHSYSAQALSRTASSKDLRRPQKDDRLIHFQDEVNELVEMPGSLFKIRIPIFSVSTNNDQIIPNEEDIKSWSQHSSLFHEHYSIEGATLGHFHLHSRETNDILAEIIHRLNNETFSDDN